MQNSCFYIALGILVLTVCFAILQHRRSTRSAIALTPVRVVMIGVFLAAILLHYPLYHQIFLGESFVLIQSVLGSIHNTLRMFVLDGELTAVDDFLTSCPCEVARWYMLLTAFLYVFGPILTFSVVLSFFKNVQAYRRFMMHLFSETYIFSELNERSLALAASLKKNHGKALIVFTDVYEADEEEISELRERARLLDAICFKCDITALNMKLHRKTNRIKCFTISADEGENVRQSLALIHKYGQYENMALYIFSTGAESELLFQDVSGNGMQIRRINHSRSLISQLMYYRGKTLFDHAVEQDGNRQINAVVIGMGGYGTEMLKALSWCGQMTGYRLSVHAFDQRTDSARMFAAQCPELMSPARNGVDEEGESYYRIEIHDGIDIRTDLFEQTLLEVGCITHVFVSLGSDPLNIKAAVMLREFCERQGYDPCIQAIVYDAYQSEHLANISNFKGKPYRIDFIGNLNDSFSERVLLNSEVEQTALQRHLSYQAPESDFWSYEYNYRSSTASAIHRKLRIDCGIPGADKPVAERTLEERDALALLEHKRWNAYMRSEGYRFSGSMDPATRNDLGKVHNFLVPFEALPEKEKRKDDT